MCETCVEIWTFAVREFGGLVLSLYAFCKINLLLGFWLSSSLVDDQMTCISASFLMLWCLKHPESSSILSIQSRKFLFLAIIGRKKIRFQVFGRIQLRSHRKYERHDCHRFIIDSKCCWRRMNWRIASLVYCCIFLQNSRKYFCCFRFIKLCLFTNKSMISTRCNTCYMRSHSALFIWRFQTVYFLLIIPTFQIISLFSFWLYGVRLELENLSSCPHVYLFINVKNTGPFLEGRAVGECGLRLR